MIKFMYFNKIFTLNDLVCFFSKLCMVYKTKLYISYSYVSFFISDPIIGLSRLMQQRDTSQQKAISVHSFGSTVKMKVILLTIPLLNEHKYINQEIVSRQKR